MRNPVIVGERVYLRPLEFDDARELAKASHNETDVFMGRGRHLSSPIALEHYIRDLYEQQPTHDEIQFAVCLIENDSCIGTMGLEFVDLINGVGESVSWIHSPEHRSRGYGTEAKHLFLEYVFHRLHLERIVSFVLESNTRSAAALIKQGYRHAGQLKYDEIKNGVFQGYTVFDLTPEEWLDARNQWQAENQRRREQREITSG
jgi:[ribosomal protein S5]-alanine N-acetyltransferase